MSDLREDTDGFSIELGNGIAISSVVEQEAPFFDFKQFFPELTNEVLEEHRSWLEPRFLDPPTGKIVLRIQSYVVRTPHQNILIDPCIGNHKPRPTRPFWNMMNSDRWERNLAAAGVTVHDIDYVMCTHLHTDHVGWNTRLENGRWVPTFPRAKYLMAEGELAHWSARQKASRETCPWITDSVLPVIEAGKAEVVKNDYALNDLVRLVPTPGHTVDHCSVILGRAIGDAVITGDMIHSPIQAMYPELGMFVDYDPKQAGRTRRELFGRYSDSPVLFFTAHFPATSVGHIVSWKDAFRFVP